MRHLEPIDPAPVTNPIQLVGRRITDYSRSVGFGILIILESFLYSFQIFTKRRHEFIRQMMNCGVRSLFITSIVAIFTGMILALQAGLILKSYNQEVQVGTLVAKTMCREMGPFMAALILAASVGSAYAAEIGTMTVSEEVTALQIMSINPLSFLVTPRLWAMIFMCPALTVFTNVLGVIGGMIVASTQLSVSPEAYYDNALQLLTAAEIHKGLLKSVVFAIIIVGISAYQGFTTRDGAVGVGKATRKAVVVSFLYILMSGYFISRIFY